MKRTLNNIAAALLILCVGNPQALKAQLYEKQRNGILIHNVLSNALISGIGGAINKKEGQKLHHAFFSNFLKGMAGGLIKYSAKYNVYVLNNQALGFYAPINRLQFFVGHSITMNAAHNRKFLQTFYCNFYGIDLRYNDPRTEGLSARISLATVLQSAYFAANGDKLNLFRSLEYGLLFFESSGSRLPSQAQAGFNAVAFHNSPAVPIDLGVLPHELVHTYQMYDYFGIAAMYNEAEQKFLHRSKFYQNFSKIFVADYEVLFFTAAYLLQPQPRYFNNFFEFEAHHFQTRSFLRRR